MVTDKQMEGEREQSERSRAGKMMSHFFKCLLVINCGLSLITLKSHKLYV